MYVCIYLNSLLSQFIKQHKRKPNHYIMKCIHCQFASFSAICCWMVLGTTTKVANATQNIA